MPKPTYQTTILSGSSNYLPINITATASGSANIIHTADATAIDEIWLDAYNYSNNDAILYLMLGGSSPHQIVSIPVPSQRGVIPILKGQRYTGSVVVSAYASVTSVISITGQVNRIVVT